MSAFGIEKDSQKYWSNSWFPFYHTWEMTSGNGFGVNEEHFPTSFQFICETFMWQINTNEQYKTMTIYTPWLGSRKWKENEREKKSKTNLNFHFDLFNNLPAGIWCLRFQSGVNQMSFMFYILRFEDDMLQIGRFASLTYTYWSFIIKLLKDLNCIRNIFCWFCMPL